MAFPCAIAGGFLLSSPHTSTFVTYQPAPAAPAAPAAADNGWWIGLAAGLGPRDSFGVAPPPGSWWCCRFVSLGVLEGGLEDPP